MRKRTATASSLLVVLVLAPLLSAASLSPRAESIGSEIGVGGVINQGQALVSPNSAFEARMQTDGNFVVYNGTKAIWHTKTFRTDGERVVLQTDNNLVLYGANALWNTRTVNTGADRLTMQNDGNLVLYDGDRAIWSSKGGYVGHSLNTKRRTLRTNGALVSKNRTYRAKMQTDGNFVIYNRTKAIWHTKTFRTNGKRVVLQGDGNVVLYGSRALWNTRTAGSQGKRLTMQNDGNLVLYAGSRALWSSRGGRVSMATNPARITLPWAVGQSWSANGPHADRTGGARHSVDVAGGDGRILAARAGTVRYGSCVGGQVLWIDHAGGWRTSYYHVEGVRVTNGQAVRKGDWIGNIGTAAPCGGGVENGAAHLHFSLWRYGQPFPLDNFTLGGWTIRQGSNDYLGRWIRNRDGYVHTVPSTGYFSCGCINNDGSGG